MLVRKGLTGQQVVLNKQLFQRKIKLDCDLLKNYLKKFVDKSPESEQLSYESYFAQLLSLLVPQATKRNFSSTLWALG